MQKILPQRNAVSVSDFKLLTVSSAAFANNGMIPEKYTCDGENVNPPLHIEGIPEPAKSLVLIIDDLDAPQGSWIHWLVWDIPVTHQLKENMAHGTQGLTDFRIHGYSGPCPPKGTHRYFFKVYALDQLLHLPGDNNRNNLDKAMSEHILGYGELVGLYRRKHPIH